MHTIIDYLWKVYKHKKVIKGTASELNGRGTYVYILPIQKIIIYLFIYLFIYGCVGSSFLCEGFL